jgi:hypothetical protein
MQADLAELIARVLAASWLLAKRRAARSLRLPTWEGEQAFTDAQAGNG